MNEIMHRTLEINGYKLHLAEVGEGPLVLFSHGFPELWRCWQYQLPEVAKAGFKAVAIDMPGYGQSEAPDALETYTQMALSDMMAALATELGYETFISVGHDWGAPTAWYTAMRYPERVKAVACLSIPHARRALQPPTEGYKRIFKDNFFYMLYFQQPGVAELELEADIPRFLRAIYWSGTGENLLSGDYTNQTLYPKSAKMLDTLKDPGKLPQWLSNEQMEDYIEQYTQSGLRGPINYYRALDLNWELAGSIEDWHIHQPALFLYGDKDPASVVGGDLQRMDELVPRLEKHCYENCGHWIQQEKPEEVNRDLIAFLLKHS